MTGPSDSRDLAAVWEDVLANDREERDETDDEEPAGDADGAVADAQDALGEGADGDQKD